MEHWNLRPMNTLFPVSIQLAFTDQFIPFIERLIPEAGVKGNPLADP